MSPASTSSANSINSGLIEWAVSQVGAERILFGTDTPLYFVASQKARIEHAEIDQAAKRAILYDNAARLLDKERKKRLNETRPKLGECE
jgi:predicted TIM-barrel fold metal-dependent hydrolase